MTILIAFPTSTPPVSHAWLNVRPKSRRSIRGVALTAAPRGGGAGAPGETDTVFASCMFDIIGGPMDGKQDRRTRVLLPTVTVITIGEAPSPATPTPSTPSAAPAASGAAPSPSPTSKYDTAPSTTETLQRYIATLSVDAEDAPKLVHATQQCWLYLALLGPKATASAGDWVDSQELFE